MKGSGSIRPLFHELTGSVLLTARVCLQGRRLGHRPRLLGSNYWGQVDLLHAFSCRDPGLADGETQATKSQALVCFITFVPAACPSSGLRPPSPRNAGRRKAIAARKPSSSPPLASWFAFRDVIEAFPCVHIRCSPRFQKLLNRKHHDLSRYFP